MGEEFLVEQDGAGNSHLIPGVPLELTMDPWQLRRVGKPGPDDRPEGIGSPQTLTIYDGESPVAKLRMPPQMSLNIGADLLDVDGNIVAWLRSSNTRRHLPIEGGAYNIFGASPQIDGHAGTDGKYLWATVKAPGFGNTNKVLNPAGKELFQAFAYTDGGPPPHNFTLKTVGKQGVMLGSKTDDKKKHMIQAQKVSILYSQSVSCMQSILSTMRNTAIVEPVLLHWFSCGATHRLADALSPWSLKPQKKAS